MRLYNFSHIQRDRLWLQNILVSDSSDSSEDEDDKPITEKDLQEMLKLHLYKKKYKKKFYTNPDVSIFNTTTTQPNNLGSFSMVLDRFRIVDVILVLSNPFSLYD